MIIFFAQYFTFFIIGFLGAFLFFYLPSPFHGVFLGYTTLVCLFVVIITKVLKNLFKKKRKKEPYRSFATFSFPSTHSAGLTALSGMTFFIDSKLALVTFLLSCLVIYSRIRLHYHSFIDVLGGVAVGVFCILILLNFNVV